MPVARSYSGPVSFRHSLTTRAGDAEEVCVLSGEQSPFHPGRAPYRSSVILPATGCPAEISR